MDKTISSDVSTDIFSKGLDDEGKILSSKHTKRLLEILSKTSVPGVSQDSHKYLLSVIETWRQIEEMKAGFDECGKRYLFSAKINEYINSNSQDKDKTNLDASNWVRKKKKFY
jgi:hypothetical protein